MREDKREEGGRTEKERSKVTKQNRAEKDKRKCLCDASPSNALPSSMLRKISRTTFDPHGSSFFDQNRVPMQVRLPSSILKNKVSAYVCVSRFFLFIFDTFLEAFGLLLEAFWSIRRLFVVLMLSL